MHGVAEGNQGQKISENVSLKTMGNFKKKQWTLKATASLGQPLV